MKLRYFRDVDRREVDFVVTEKRRPVFFLEAKLGDEESSRALRYLHERFPGVDTYRISLRDHELFEDRQGIRHLPAASYLARLV